MAESDAGRSATGTVSTEEAERLSERFRPSWEDDPPTIPREAPPPAAPAPPALAAPPPVGAPAAAPAPPVVAPVPVRAPAPAAATSAPTAPAAAPALGTTAKLPAMAAPGGAPALAEPRRPTLLGLSPEAMAAIHGPRAGAEDLDWEVPTHQAPEAAVGTITDKLPAVAAPASATPAAPAIGTGTLKLPAVAAPATAPTTSPSAEPAPPAVAVKAEEPELNIDVEEVPPDSKPSGIGEKYVPKEEGAPPVVLNEDVQAAERRAQAALEAQHRARRAPTIARLKVVEPPETLVSADPFVPPKKGNGRFVALAIGVVVLVAGTALVFGGRGKSSADKVEPAERAVAPVAPDTAAPPPPPLPSAAAPSQPTAAAEAPAPVAAPAEPLAPAPAATEKAPGPASKHAAGTKAPGPASKPTASPKAAPTTKAAVAAGRPPGKPAGATSKPSGKAVIVRDSPF